MNICEKKENNNNYRHPKLVAGHIYKVTSGYVLNDIPIYICTTENQLVHLVSGRFWNSNANRGFGVGNCTWEDVTDKYCLTKI